MRRGVNHLRTDFAVGHHLRRIELTQPEPHCQHPAQRLVDILFGQQALRQRFRQRPGIGAIVQVATRENGLCSSFLESWILSVGGHKVLHCAAVWNHKSVEFPLVAEDVGQEQLVLHVGHSIDAVVRRHDRRRMSCHDAGLELRQIVLSQHAFAHQVSGGAYTISLLVVDRIMLERGRQLQVLRVVPLRASYVGDGGARG